MSNLYKILVIDDEAEILALFNNFFKGKKYNITSASCGLDALKIIETEKDRFDIIITDLVLPDISGSAITAIAKQKWPKIPIIAITGGGKDLQVLAEEAQADLILSKPFNLSGLEKKIIKLLKKKNK